MTPDASGWRSSERYAHVADMTASDVAWEWLRRNESYDRDFRALGDNESDPRTLTDRIGRRWGLRFPRRPDAGTSRSARDLASPGRHKRHRSWRTSGYSIRKR
ncbi:transcriptional regulator domain-containing protein [Bosea vestrisii]|uniref:Transcriptional regulator domain-containing protein n=1 Tax=Bosea vestrisii TaxID=151416 RepID=A0ABW0HHT9_9HYPH